MFANGSATFYIAQKKGQATYVFVNINLDHNIAKGRVNSNEFLLQLFQTFVKRYVQMIFCRKKKYFGKFSYKMRLFWLMQIFSKNK